MSRSRRPSRILLAQEFAAIDAVLERAARVQEGGGVPARKEQRRNLTSFVVCYRVVVGEHRQERNRLLLC
jgi:hypothetical protein